jgi:cytochrome c-type biogenesis protein
VSELQALLTGWLTELAAALPFGFAFGVGMAAVLVTLTLALAFLKQGLVKWLRRAVPYVQLASAILIVLAGAYVISYWLLSGNGGVLSR